MTTPRKTFRKRKPTKSVFRKGDPRINYSGRPRGSKNKFTADLKQMILNSLDKAGGENWFLALAKKDKRTFGALIGRLLPTRIGGDAGNPIQVEQVKSGLSNLSDAELATLEKLFTKIGVTLP